MTSAVFIINTDELKQIQRKAVKPSHFVEISHRIRKLAKAIDNNWQNFSSEDRDYLKQLAYDLIKPPKGIKSLWLNLRALPYVLYLKITNQEQDFLDCVEAVDYFVDSILNAIENESQMQQQVLSDTLEEVTNNPQVGELVDHEHGSEWLRELSNRSLS